MFKILVAEDDAKLRKTFCTFLENNKFIAIPVCNGFEALEKMESTNVDLIVTDAMMPKLDGYELVDALRKYGDETPVLIISERGDIEAKRQGFSRGTDDYMVKPVNLDELLMRIIALLKRSGINTKRAIKIGETELDRTQFTVKFENKVLPLPPKEFYLLFKLATYQNKVLTKYQLIDDVWGIDCNTDIHTLEVHIARLRKKLKSNKDFEIITVRGLGYKIATKK